MGNVLGCDRKVFAQLTNPSAKIHCCQQHLLCAIFRRGLAKISAIVHKI